MGVIGKEVLLITMDSEGTGEVEECVASGGFNTVAPG